MYKKIFFCIFHNFLEKMRKKSYKKSKFLKNYDSKNKFYKKCKLKKVFDFKEYLGVENKKC